MAKNKKTTSSADATTDTHASDYADVHEPSPVDSTPSSPNPSSRSSSRPGKKSTDTTADAPSSSLTISRNKHWRYISAFHGPWLQLPPEILETLAHSNYLSPRPRQTHPGVLFDLLKIRTLVDEASDLAVRAQNGTASSALAIADNGLPGGGLGFSCRGGAGGHAKLSPERKYRMRDQATQKLAQAYRLDEIAASVAAMQSASALDNVASLVLQRAPGNADAAYVHFFHEKIPSRMMSECTPLAPLNDVITRMPAHPAPFRTRALTKIFKGDHAGAVQDLTESLVLCRLEEARHRAIRNQLVPMKVAREEVERRKVRGRDWMQENRVADLEQPKGLELQLLFQRGNQYLTIACQHIRSALENFRAAHLEHKTANGNLKGLEGVDTHEGSTAYQKGLEARETVRKNAKRALRDYTAFFTQLDYAYEYAPMVQSHGRSFEHDTLREATNGTLIQPQIEANGRHDSDIPDSSALVKRSSSFLQERQSPNGRLSPWASSSPAEPVVHEMSALLSASPPASLPPFPPPTSTALVTKADALKDQPHTPPLYDEMITYHPLMPETLHSLLLTHCLLQTPPTALLRHANNAARLARLADGYPCFLSARSPARADWAEILRKTNNWIGLTDTWDSLCKPPSTKQRTRDSSAKGNSRGPPAGRNNSAGVTPVLKPVDKVLDAEGITQKRSPSCDEGTTEPLVHERLADDGLKRAVDELKQRRLSDEDENSPPQAPPVSHAHPTAQNGGGKPRTTRSAAEPLERKTGVAKDEEYLIGTERAEALVKWILEAPAVVESRPKKGQKKKKKASKTVGGAGARKDDGGGGGGGGGAAEFASLRLDEAVE